ncbi:hypothetical protein TNIN_269081 [Trichonephila inaurata madagascariensis]|uniref:Uncharacterized protein n=1 Tax=Trichonephila inaurata madagascariensis TaxID=2747483 RepID=A0A8X6MAL4_9ARAC|nr:hypothetical protein TNIN_269081 [Trichonephila inaurata madagascariensis]
MQRLRRVSSWALKYSKSGRPPAYDQILEGKETVAWEAFKSVNCEPGSDGHGGKLNQDTTAMGRRYQGRWDDSMLAHYCWTVIRNTQASTYKRQSKGKCSLEIN